MSKFKTFSAALLTAGAITFSAAASAAPELVIDSPFYSTDSWVEISFAGAESSHNLTLAVGTFEPGTNVVAHWTDVFSTTSGSLNGNSPFRFDVAEGSFLLFRIYDHNTGSFFTAGIPGLNTDGTFHSLAIFNPAGPSNPNLAYITFEDLKNGGDRDYNDLKILVKNVSQTPLSGSGSGTIPAVPEPETWAMLLAGLGIVSATVRRRKA